LLVLATEREGILVAKESLHATPVKKVQAWKLVVIALVVTGVVSGVLYQQTRAYVIYSAEKDIENMLLQHKGVHHYV